MLNYRISDHLPHIGHDRLHCQPADDEFESEKHAIYRYVVAYQLHKFGLLRQQLM